MIPNTRDPANQELPNRSWSGNRSLRKGRITISPKNPYTTEGIPERTSQMGFIMLRNFDGAISEM